MSTISGLGSFHIDPSSIYQNHNSSTGQGDASSGQNLPLLSNASDHKDRISYPSDKEIEERNSYEQSKSRNMNVYRSVMNFGNASSSSQEIGSAVDIMA